MTDKKQTVFFEHILGIFMVFGVRELAGALARAVWALFFQKTGNEEAAGLCITGITALFMLFALWPLYCIRIGREKEYNLLNRRTADWILLIPFGICAALGLNQFMNLLHLTEIKGSYEATRQVLFSGTRVISLLILGFAVPIAEELMFRGLIFRHLKSFMGRKTAVILSALLFGVYHGNMVQGIYAFLMGLLLVWVYERFGSIFAPVLFHCAANSFVYLAADVEALGQNDGIIASCVLGMAGAVFIFMHFYQKNNNI